MPALAGLTQDFEVNHAAELPAFTGLGSSSSFVVGLLNTIYAFQHRMKPNLELAYEAIDVERNMLKESVGCQDQTFAAVGGFNLIEFRGMHDFVVHRIPFTYSRLGEFEEHLLVYFTGSSRAEDLAARQVKRVGQNKNRLGEMRALVDEGYRILVGGGSLARFGEVLHKAWLLKRELDVAITNSTVDDIYNAGIEAARWAASCSAGRRRLRAVLRAPRTQGGRARARWAIWPRCRSASMPPALMSSTPAPIAGGPGH